MGKGGDIDDARRRLRVAALAEQELALIEALVGRTPPFEVNPDPGSGGPSRYDGQAPPAIR